jgi:ATP-dependent DNA ligase
MEWLRLGPEPAETRQRSIIRLAEQLGQPVGLRLLQRAQRLRPIKVLKSYTPGGSREMAYVLFYLLYLDGRDLPPLPLVERKAILEKLLAKLPIRSPVQSSSDVTGQGAKFFKLACKRHLEGIV